MLNLKNKLNTNAFTLVELIVVIVILAILATIAFLSFSSQSGSARDSTRLSDISSIKKGMEMYNVGSGLYPTPDKPTSFTYSGGTIWNQGTIGDSAYRLIQKTLSKKVKDPLKDSEYDYSLASNKKEYQVAGNFENPTSFEKTYNPFESDFLISQFSILNSPDANALGGTGANVYISGNYNGVLLKVFTGSTYYFVPTPTLFGLNENGTGNVIYDNTFGSGKDILSGVNNVAIFDSSKVYSTGSDNLGSDDINDLMTTMKEAYATGNVTTPAVQNIVNATGSALIDLGNGLVKNSLGGGITGSSDEITYSCATPPASISNIGELTSGMPTSAGQAWTYSSTPGNCTYTCLNGYSGNNCEPATSYSHILSQGNRKEYKPSLISYSYEGTWFRNETTGQVSSILDGVRGYNVTNNMGLNTSSYTNNNSLIITFSLPTLVTEIKFYLGHNISSRDHGTWVVQKFINGSWSGDLSSPVSLSGGNGVAIVFAMNNSDFVTQYRLKQVSGSTDGGGYFEEIEFEMVQ